MTQAADSVSERSIIKIATVSLVGTTIEWYDFFLYGTAAALVFPILFFSGDLPPLIGLMASFSTFAIGFIARPLGGVLFGHFGDRVGRKRALVVALVLMGGATTLIGCLPTYVMIGWAAPLLLVILRFLQGLAIGGQWGGAVLLITETAPKDKRGFYGSFAQVGAPFGVVLANLIFLLVSANLSEEAFIAWGWRVPFLVSIALVFLAIYVELRIQESRAFRELEQVKSRKDHEEILARSAQRGDTFEEARQEIIEERTPSPILEAIRRYPRTIMLAAGAFISIQISFYVMVAWVVAYGTNSEGLGLRQTDMLIAVVIAALIMCPAILASAAYSDRKGRRGVYMLGAASTGIWAFIMFPLIQTGSTPLILIALSVGMCFVGMQYGPQAAFLSELFTTKIRYSGASLGYQLGAIIGGALAPIIATALYATFNSTVGVSIYIALGSIITIVSVYLLRETYRETMVDTIEQQA